MSNPVKVHPDLLADFDAPARRSPAWALRASAPKIAVPEISEVAHVTRGQRVQGSVDIRALVLTNGDAQTGMPLCAIKGAIRGGVITLPELAALVAPDEREKLAKLLTPEPANA